MMRKLLSGGVLAVAVVAVLAGCAGMMAKEAPPTLYERLRITDDNRVPLGGRAALALIVDDFVANVVADNRINARFKALQPAAVARLKTNLTDQLCQVAGGPCSYLGREMKDAHKGMKITEAEWNAAVEDLVKALDKRKVPELEKVELLALIAPVKKDIVGQ